MPGLRKPIKPFNWPEAWAELVQFAEPVPFEYVKVEDILKAEICTVCKSPRAVCRDVNEDKMPRRREGYELFQFNALPETMNEIREFSKRTKVPGTTIIRDALDVFTVLLKDCKDYPDWLARVRKAITAAGEVTR